MPRAIDRSRKSMTAGNLLMLCRRSIAHVAKPTTINTLAATANIIRARRWR